MKNSEFRTTYSTATFVVVAASAVAFMYLFVEANQPGAGHFYRKLLREDGFFEYVGALLFLGTAVVLFYCAYLSSRKDCNGYRVNKILFCFAGLVFFIGAGEEISWGQRIFSIETPEYLASINGQNETNFHNINKRFFDRGVTYITVIFVAASILLHALRITDILKIRLPSMLLLVSLCLVTNYKQYYQPFYKSGSELLNFVYYPLQPGRSRDTDCILQSFGCCYVVSRSKK